MAHPDHYLVGLLGLAMMAVGAVAWLVLLSIAILFSMRLLPSKQARTTYRIGMVLLLPFPLVAVVLAPPALKALAVIASFGSDAYVDGLRVVNKHGLLSDGRYLGVFWTAAIGAGSMIITMVFAIPVGVWYAHFSSHPKADGSREVQ